MSNNTDQPLEEELPQLCCIENCANPAAFKGLCRPCYGSAAQLIREGKTTWDELKELDLCVIADKPFVAAFKKKKGLK